MVQSLLTTSDHKKEAADFRSRVWQYRDIASELTHKNAPAAVTMLSENVDWLKHEIIYLSAEYEVGLLEAQAEDQPQNQQVSDKKQNKHSGAGQNTSQTQSTSKQQLNEMLHALNSTVRRA